MSKLSDELELFYELARLNAHNLEFSTITREEYESNRKDNITIATKLIKKVFEDEGYGQWEDLSGFNEAMTKYCKENNLMTGQEWYKRFEKELALDEFYDCRPTPPEKELMEYVLEAAKKASGL